MEADYRGKGKYYPGRIVRDRRDGTYDIDYDDGEKETRVDEKLIRPLGGSPKKAAKLEEGDKVEANYRGKGKWFKGKIARDRRDGTFDIDYDDGEKELRVDEALVRAVDGGGGGGFSPRAPVGGRSDAVIEEGSKVEANYKGKGKYYPGKITRDRRDGTFDIAYDDGEVESRVDEKMIRLRGASSDLRNGRDLSAAVAGKSGSPSLGLKLNLPPRMDVGDKVEADYRGKGKYYTGKIVRDRQDGTFDIDYDDGEMELRVDEKLIRVLSGGGGAGGLSPRGGLSSSAARSGFDRLEEGAKVEANYRGKGKFYPGKITRDRRDGTFDIAYDDGEVESRVDEKMIRLLGGSPKKAPAGRIEEGAKVEANYKGKGKFYPGKITRDRRDGTFDIAYDDGEVEARVDEKMIRIRPDLLSPTSRYSDQYKLARID